jgi:hypothetical protein
MSIRRPLPAPRARALAAPRPSFIRVSLLALGALAGTLLLASEAHGQAAKPRPAAALTPYAGYLIAGDFFEGPIGTSIASAGGPLYGAQLSIPLGSSVSVVGNAGYSSGDLKVGIPLLGGLSVGSVRTLLFDAGLELRSPSALGMNGLLTPLLQVGAGAVRHDVDVQLLKTDATAASFNVGAGADLTLGRNLGIRFLAKDYIGRFDFKEATGFDLESKTAHNWAFTAGVSLKF